MSDYPWKTICYGGNSIGHCGSFQYGKYYEFLDKYNNIEIAKIVKTDYYDPDEAAIFGSDWDELTDAVDKFISDEIGSYADYILKEKLIEEYRSKLESISLIDILKQTEKSKDLEYPELENTYF